MEKELSTLEKIDKAMKALTDKYGSINYESILLDIVEKRFIKNDDIRETVTNLSKDIDVKDLIREIAKQAIQVAASYVKVAGSETCEEFVNELRSNHIPYDFVLEYLDSNKEMLSKLIKAFAIQRYDSRLDKGLIENVDDLELRKYIYFLEPTNKAGSKNTSLLGRIANIIFNKSKMDVIANAQFDSEHRDYSLGKSLFASFDIGKERYVQADSVLIIEHPNNKNFKLMAVADGDRERVHGERASQEVIQNILSWFESLDPSYFENTEDVEELLINKLRQINVDLLKHCDDRASTFTCAIIGKEKTLVASIGNSRAYSVKDGKVERLTKDDSYIQELCDLGYFDDKKSKFHKAAEIVLRELGIEEHDGKMQIFVKPIENDYDKLLIVTDGVTKRMDDEEIEQIIASTNANKIAHVLVQNSASRELDLGHYEYGFRRNLPKGEHNTTAAVYVRK